MLIESLVKVRVYVDTSINLLDIIMNLPFYKSRDVSLRYYQGIFRKRKLA